MPKFLLVGGAGVDFYAYVPGLKEAKLGGKNPKEYLCLPFGSKTTLNDLHVHPGGSAANSAVALRQMGSPSKLVAAVGDDPMGKLLLANFKHHKVDSSGVRVMPSTKTSMSVVLLLPSGEKSILTYRGANDSLGPGDLPEAVVAASDVILLTSLPSSPNYSLFTKAISLAERHKKRLIFAPSISMLKARRKELSKLHEKFDVTIMNCEEAMEYTGEGNLRKAIGRLPGKVRVITDASGGAYALAGGRLLHSKAPQVRIADTTGAGDAFTAGFAHCYFSHPALAKACLDCGPMSSSPSMAAHAAASALQYASAVAGLKLESEGAHFNHSTGDVEMFLRKHKELWARSV